MFLSFSTPCSPPSFLTIWSRHSWVGWDAAVWLPKEQVEVGVVNGPSRPSSRIIRQPMLAQLASAVAAVANPVREHLTSHALDEAELATHPDGIRLRRPEHPLGLHHRLRSNPFEALCNEQEKRNTSGRIPFGKTHLGDGRLTVCSLEFDSTGTLPRLSALERNWISRSFPESRLQIQIALSGIKGDQNRWEWFIVISTLLRGTLVMRRSRKFFPMAKWRRRIRANRSSGSEEVI